LAQGMQAVHLNLFLDPHPNLCARLLKEHTAPTDKLVVWGGGLNIPFLRAEREGLSILDFTSIQDPDQLARLKQLGYSRLVLMNTSPLLAAVNTASGVGGFRIKDLPRELPAVAQGWRVIFESPSILILEIPR